MYVQRLTLNRKTKAPSWTGKNMSQFPVSQHFDQIWCICKNRIHVCTHEKNDQKSFASIIANSIYKTFGWKSFVDFSIFVDSYKSCSYIQEVIVVFGSHSGMRMVEMYF